MIQISPEDRPTPSAAKRNSGQYGIFAAGLILLLTLVWLFVGNGLGEIRGLFAQRDRFADVYAVLRIEPFSSSLENSSTILPLLKRLQKEHCDEKAATALGDALATLGEKRVAARLLAGFTTECPRFNALIYKAADLYFSLSDFAASRALTDKLTEAWPEVAQFHFLAAQNEQQMGDHEAAVAEFENTIEFTPNRRTVSEAVFLDAAKSFAQLRQFCKSAGILQQWVSLNLTQRDNVASQKLIEEYLAQGQCAVQGSDNFPRGDKNIIILQVSIGPASGRFILDTGASLTTLNADFARKAGLSGDREILLKTANGMRKAHLGTAPLISVGHLRASEVGVAILPDDGDKAGLGIDGLLGMSFLSRYRMEMSPTAVTLSPWRQDR